MSRQSSRICSVERAGSLDNRIRRWLQDPRRILAPYVREGTTALDVGCGPGVFSVAMAEMVGPSGRVIACDLQEGMLEKLRQKIRGTALEARVALYRCSESSIGVSERVDFALAFYMVHEVPDQDAFFGQLSSVLKPDGRLLLVEPPFHVSRKGFEETIGRARTAGLIPVDRPHVRLGRAVVLAHS